MARFVLRPVDRPEVAPRGISDRLRNQLVYFMTPRDVEGLPPLGEFDFWFRPEEVATWVDEGVFLLVSPLDTEGMTEVELSEEQETFLQWLQDNQVCHVRLEER